MITTRFISSLEKVFQEKEPTNIEFNRIIYKNEPYSFQFCLTSDKKGHLYLEIDSNIKDYIDICQVEYVPACKADYIKKDDYRIFTERTSTYYPDVLEELPSYINVTPGYWTSLWVTVKAGLPAGDYKIRFKTGDFYVRDLLSDDTFEFSVSDVQLVPCDIPITCWIYYDCIAKAHNLKLFSQNYYKMLKKYLLDCLQMGVNTIFVPIFPHPNRMKSNQKQTNVQLLDFERRDGKYYFDFSRLEKFINFAIKCGLQYFEFAHIASQQGACFAPTIFGTENGQLKEFFGINTSCEDKEYQYFLTEVFIALREYLIRKGIYQNCYFHISDEPLLSHYKAYNSIGSVLRKAIPDGKIIDALYDYKFTESNILDYPVVGTNNVAPFLDNGKDIWVYNCCDQSYDYLSNRFLNFPLLRMRVIGVQLYLNNAKGFLHWAYNYWFVNHELINPRYVTDAGNSSPAGDPFIVYYGKNGPVNSIREKTFAEAMCDYRALKTLESYKGKTFVMNLLKEYGFVGFNTYTHDEKIFMQFTNKLHNLIKDSQKSV